MKYGLSDFFSGVIYIFVIFMPGGILIAALLYGIPGLADKANSAIVNTEARWLLLIAGSFVLGHFVSHAGSAWEDWLYERSGVERAKKEVSRSLRNAAHVIVQNILPSQLVHDNNIRRWAHALLRQSESASFRDIERKDADRRFFRNFLLVMMVPIFVFLVHSIHDMQFFIYAAISIIIMMLAYRRYLNQDSRFTKLIFEALVAAYPEGIRLSDRSSKEIEARFEVKNGWDLHNAKDTGVDITQGYLSVEKEHVVRVRVQNNIGWITIKGKSTGTAQSEYEYQIPESDARAILENLCSGRIVEKIRYRIKKSGFVWEVDEFRGRNQGLVIAEIEAKSKEALEKAVKHKPEWIGADITEEYRYRNSNLAVKPQPRYHKRGRSLSEGYLE